MSNKKVKEFIDIMESYGEFLFGSFKDIKEQLEVCLATQGYWSGNSIRVYYNKNTKEFSIGGRF